MGISVLAGRLSKCGGVCAPHGVVDWRGQPQGLIDRLLNVDVVEAYSPPRVTPEAEKFGLKPGEAWDLTNGWDFTRKDHRKLAEEYIEREQPLVVIGGPPCTPFGQLQSLNPKTEKCERKWKEGVEHMRFLVKLFQKQVEQGSVFLHEQPAHAMSWMIFEIRKMLAEIGSQWWKQTNACTV